MHDDWRAYNSCSIHENKQLSSGFTIVEPETFAVRCRQSLGRAWAPAVIRGVSTFIGPRPPSDEVELLDRAKSQPHRRPKGRKRPQRARTPGAEMAQRQNQKFEFSRFPGPRARGMRQERRFLVDDLANRRSNVVTMLGCPPAQELAALLFGEPERVDTSAAEPKRKATAGVNFDDENVRQHVANRYGIDVRSIGRRPFALQSIPIVVKFPGNRQSHLIRPTIVRPRPGLARRPRSLASNHRRSRGRAITTVADRAAAAGPFANARKSS